MGSALIVNRLGKARQLLLACEMNVGEAALGFEDSNYFSCFFSEAFGVAPSKV